MGSCTEIALFAGAGGGVLAARYLLAHRIVCYVEFEPYCQEVLKARMQDGLIDEAPIWDDVRTFDGRPWRGLVDVVSAGFPCQPFSCAGKGLEGDDPRDMWPDTARIIREVRPRVVHLENVPAITIRYLGRVLGDLAEIGYDARWGCLSASAVGAPHRRERWWCLATDAERGAVPLEPGGGRRERPERVVERGA